MERWQKSLREGLTDVGVVARRFGLDEAKLREVAEAFRFRVSKYYYSLIREKGDAIYRQCIPDPAELEGNADLMDDPLAEERHSPVPNVVQRYPDRCLLLVSNECATYCRFCTRKRKFGAHGGIDPSNLEAAFQYIEAHAEVRDVLVSGGDPLLLPDARLGEILRRLRAIPHVEIIRIGTRTPCTLPERITVKLARLLKQFHPLYVHVHFEHPDELTPAAVKALARLADAGIPLGCQTVLLKGVNDDPKVMKALMHKLLQARVRPYYIFQSDLVYGTEHFRTPLSKGVEIIRSLRSWTSGLACPHFVIDLPDGGGKVPVSPDYLLRRNGRKMTFRTYRGETRVYPDITE